MRIDPRNNTRKITSLELIGIQKKYQSGGNSFCALKEANLKLEGSGIVSIIGPSGCGKTTLLNIIGGLDHQTSGDLLINGVSTKSYKGKDWDLYRNKYIGFVFQNYNLVWYKNVLENVCLPLEIAGVKRAERKAKALAALEKVGLKGLEKKKPNQLSGGQMQRVAIARAIVNEPSIILADEPTGALDSEASLLVLNLLKEISKDHLVLLVTHNETLAQKYSDRIITMKDGLIVSDFGECKNPAKTILNCDSREKNKCMSPLSALSSAGRTILLKKARISLTALSCSFGILGVALILAINNGFSSYVSNVERSVASSVPIALSPLTTRYHYENEENLPEYPDGNNVNISDYRKSYSEVIYNNFSEEYFSYLNAITKDKNCPAYGSAMSVMFYRKNLTYHFMKEDPSGSVRLINQYQNASSSGYTVASMTSLPGTILHEMYGDEDNMSSLYDTIAGKFPTQADELALVLDSYNRIDFSTMKALGFYVSDASMKGSLDTLTFDQILGSEFKCYTNSEYYGIHSLKELEEKTKTPSFPAYNSLSLNISDSDGDGAYEAEVKDEDPEKNSKTCRVIEAPTGAEVYADEANHKPIRCKIVGILRPSKGSYIQLMPSSLAYTPALTKRIVADLENPVTQKMAEYQKDNWLIPRGGEGSNWNFDGKQKLQEAFSTLASAITTIKKTGRVDDASNDLALFKNQLNSCFCFINANGALKSGNYSYYSSPSGYLGLCKTFGAEFPQANLRELIAEMALGDSLALGPDFFDGEANPNLVDYVASMNAYSLVDSILIFPSGLSSKDRLTSYLDAWNQKHPDQKNQYIDAMADFTSSLGTLIQVLSIVLVVFASVSLVVSSIMTAIITYLSVVERTKEIGILRACGARKRDVGRLFEFECLFVGLFAGLLGVGLSSLACIPLNSILNQRFPSNHLGAIAKLNPVTALVLVLVSMLLSFLSGYIPSRLAAKKDPVVCLRSE